MSTPARRDHGLYAYGSLLAPSDQPLIESIVCIRGERVILDSVLAALYGVSVGQLNQAVKRASARFPADFMFQLTAEETANLRSQIVTSSSRGGRRHRPYAFTEHGVAMLSSVLRSPRAVRVNIEIMRAFVRLRRWMADSRELSARLDALEARYDSSFKQIFDAIRQLMEAPAKEGGRVGFRTDKGDTGG